MKLGADCESDNDFLVINMRSNNVSGCPIIVEGLTKMGILALWGFNLYFFLQVNSHNKNKKLWSNTWIK